MGILTKAKKAVKQKLDAVKLQAAHMYDYSTPDARVNTIRWLYAYAKNQRMEQVEKWLKYNDYYEGRHITQEEIKASCEAKGLPFIPAIIQDPFIHVESQIIPEIPDFEFSGRDDDLDNIKAKQREYVVRYVIEDNRIDSMNTENERQLNKLGNAFWKVSFDYSQRDGEAQGKIIIGNPDPANIFPDPAALELEDCEYIDYVYRMHKIKAGRVFKDDLKRLGLTVFDLAVDGLYQETEIYDTTTHDVMTDTLQVIEHWFKQPFDGSDTYEYTTEDGVTHKETVTWESGDIACTIIIGQREIRYIPKYWVNTGQQNKLYPFVKYCKVPINKSFWDRSELAPILDLVDAADRELAITLLNDNFTANDIVLMEENSLSDDSEAENIPGAIWKVKSGQINNVRRMGGLSNLNGGLKDTISIIRELIKETIGNYSDINQGGAPPSNVKTLGGLVELKQQNERRQSLKKADRTAGFERLFELVDWTALEFYDDNRLIFLGAEGDVQEQMQINANGMMSQEQQIMYAQQQQAMQQQAQQTGHPAPPMQPPNMDRSKGPVVFRFDSSQYAKDGYYPRIDTTVQVGDGITHNKAFTLSATETIANMNITVENFKIVCEMIDIMMLPNRKEIKQYLNQYFSNLQMGIPKTSIAFKDLPADGKVQMAQKIGLQIQQPPEMDAQGVPIDILAQNQPNVAGRVPLASQSQMPQLTHHDLINGLTPEELAHLQQNPHLIDQVMGGNSHG